MKYLFIIILLFICIFTSCNAPKPGNMFSDGDRGDVTKIRYFQDQETQKCFAERGMNDYYSFTCVECDSLVLLKQ